MRCVPVGCRAISCRLSSQTKGLKYEVVLTHLVVVRNNLTAQKFRNISIVTEKKKKGVSTSMQCHTLIDSLLLLNSLKTWRGCSTIDQTRFFMILRNEHQNAVMFTIRPSPSSISAAHFQTYTNIGIPIGLDILGILIILHFVRYVYLNYAELYSRPQADEGNEDVHDHSVNNFSDEREIFNDFLNRIGGSPSSVVDENQSCSICLESLKHGSLFQPGTCSHIFHRDCLSQWLESGGRNCPLCRRDFISAIFA